MRLRAYTVLVAAPLLLAACGSKDTESMLAGLQKAGMPPSKAQCYSDALADALNADGFNQVAEYLAGGNSFDEATKRARRKYGAKFREQIKEAKDALAGCNG